MFLSDCSLADIYSNRCLLRAQSLAVTQTFLLPIHTCKTNDGQRRLHMLKGSLVFYLSRLSCLIARSHFFTTSQSNLSVIAHYFLRWLSNQSIDVCWCTIYVLALWLWFVYNLSHRLQISCTTAVSIYAVLHSEITIRFHSRDLALWSIYWCHCGNHSLGLYYATTVYFLLCSLL